MPTVSQSAQTSTDAMNTVTPHRRPTASSRLRENRPQQGSSGSNTTANANSNAARARRKSRSPEAGGVVANVTSRSSIWTFAKKKRQGHNATPTMAGPSTSRTTLGNSSGSRPHSMNLVDEFGVERGRRGKNNHNARPVSQTDNESHALSDAQNGRKQTKSRRKDKQKEAEWRRSRSKSRDGMTMSITETTLVDGEEMGDVDENHPGSAFDSTDYSKLKEEVEAIRKHLAAAKKTIHKQNKAMEDLKKDVANAQKSHSEERQTSARLKAESKKLNEMVTAVEANLACQICMDMLLKPYGLSPCGHVLCLNCLQEWFRRTPPGDEDMEDDEDPEAVIYRKKTCPVCRTEVFHRPIPVFVIKSIASAFDKAKPGSPRQPSPPREGDPWEGIFPEAKSPYYDDYDDEDDYDGDSMGDEDDDASDGHWPFANYGSDSDDDYYYGEYVHPHWAPPTVHIDPEDYPFDEVTDDVLAMLRRGATPQMIMLFQMEYTHDGGLVATMDGNKIYLGWNISLQPEDLTGEEFMEWIDADIVNHPERWDRADDDEGENWSAWRLVREEEDEEFNDTDSEFWAEELAELEDF